MEWLLKEHGDFLEMQALDFIQSSIPAYELIWQRFIGHKGNGNMADMISISKEFQEERKVFAQNHYTVLESLYSMKLIYEDEAKEYKEIKSLDEYRKSINQVMAFSGHLGRLVDCLTRCFEIVCSDNRRPQEARAQLKELYEVRIAVLHGKKFPISLQDGLFMIPGMKESEWNDKKKWEDLKTLEVKHISEHLKAILDELTGLVSKLLYELLEYVNEFMAKHKLQLKSPESEYSKVRLLKSIMEGSPTCGDIYFPPASGIMTTYPPFK